MKHKIPTLLILAAVSASSLLTGCHTITDANGKKRVVLTEKAKAQISANEDYAFKKTVSIVEGGIFNLGTSLFDQQKKWNFTQALGGAFYAQIPILLTADDVRNLVAINTPNKPHWAELGAQLADTYASANPKTPTEAKAVLDAIAKGLQTAGPNAGDAISVP